MSVVSGRMVSVFLSVVFALVFRLDAIERGVLQDPFEWMEPARIPVESARDGAVYGVLPEGVVVVGGLAAAGSGEERLWVAGGNFYPVDPDGVCTGKVPFNFPEAFGYGAVASTGDGGLILAGGLSARGALAQVHLLRYDRGSSTILVKALAPLPVPLVLPGITVRDGVIYVAGGWSEKVDSGLYSLSLSRSNAVWELLSSLPKESRVAPSLVCHELQRKKGVYVIGGYRTFLPETRQLVEASAELDAYNLDSKKWVTRQDASFAVGESVAAALGLAHMVVYPKTGDGSAFSGYHTITDRWIPGGASRVAAVPLGIAEVGKSKWFLCLAKEELLLYRQQVHAKESRALPVLDFVVLGGYFLIMIWMGWFFSKRGKTTNDYFRGGNRVPGWAAGISIVATKLSAISYMSLPALAFSSDYRYLLVQVSQLVAAVFVVRYVLPIFCRLNLTTAYEYLEQRYSVGIRVIVSMAFLSFELFRMGIQVFLPSLVLSVMTGWNIHVCILAVGLVATVYTATGGFEAVVWTDVVQGLVMVGGAMGVIVVAFLSSQSHGGGIVDSLVQYEKLRFFDGSFNLTTVTLWVVLLYVPGSINQYVSMQPIVQRFVSTRNEKAAAHSMWVTATIGPFQLFLFFLMGTAMFIFYQALPERLDPAMEQGDQLLAWFIIKELPAGISGLLIASIFAASMSSFDSSISSQTTVWVTDVYKRFVRGVEDAKALRVAKVLTWVLGVFGTVSGLIFAAYDIQSIFEQYFEILQLFGGGLAGLFVLGMFTGRANAKGALIGYFVSGILLYYVKRHTHVNFLTFGTIGMVSCVLCGYLASLWFRPPEKSLAGLTYKTRYPRK